MKRIRNILFLLFILMLSVVFIGCGGDSFEREYHEDICIEIEDGNADIVIKEWTFLLGSGAEVYYHCDNEMILLGKTTGADDGFCPFKEGLYDVEVEGDTVTVKWCFDPAKKDADWRSASYTLPSK